MTFLGCEPDPTSELIDLSKVERALPPWLRATYRWDPMRRSWPTGLITEPGVVAAAINLTDEEAACRWLGGFGRTRERGLNAVTVLATICDWSAVTVQQLAAITGVIAAPATRAAWDDLPEIVTDLFAAGLICRTQIPGGPIVLSADRNAVTECFAEVQTTELRDQLLGGLPEWADPPADIRRSVIATEAALRIQAAFGAEQLVVPRRFATYRHMSDDSSLVGGADAVIYSADKYPAVALVMVTAGGAKRIGRQVQEALDFVRHTSSTMVWFVEAGDPGASDRRISRALTRAVAGIAAGPDRRYASRLAVSRWRWFWPADGQATMDSIDGLAYRPGRCTWEPVCMGRDRGDYDVDVLEGWLPARTGASLIHFARDGQWLL